MIRNPGHGNGFTTGLTPFGQSDVEQLGGFFGIVIEQLIEIPHAVKNQLIPVLLFDAQVLLHHWRVV